MNQSALRLLLLRFALMPILIMCAFVGLISWQLEKTNQLRALATRTTSTLFQCDKILNSLVDEETSVRGYVITADPSYLEPYHAARERVDGELDELATQTAGNSALSVEVEGIRQDFARFTAANYLLVVAETDRQVNSNTLQSQKLAMDSLRARLTRLIGQLNEARDANRTRLLRWYTALPIFAIVGGALVALFVIWDGIAQFGRISRAFGVQIAEIELQRSSLDTTLHSIGDAVIVCDTKKKITLFNPTAESLTGWDVAEAVGKDLSTCFSIIDEETRSPAESPVDKVLRTGQITGLANHTLLIRRDGKEIAIDDSGAPIRNDKNEIVGMVLVFRDIQARRVAERELVLRNAELESLLLNSPVGFATFDSNYHLLRVNQALAEIDGIELKAHLGKNLEELLPHIFPTFAAIIDTVFREGRTVHREFTGPSRKEPTDQRQWLTWFYPVFAGDSSKPVLVGAIVVDTTERWHAQETLVRTEKLVAVGRLAASIAHEMNNPLTSVTNLLYLIACDETLNSETRAYVDRANIELDRVSKMATQTLRFARRSVAPAKVDLEEIMNGAILLFSGRLSHEMITVNQRTRTASTFHGYTSEVVQILSNLLGNAIDAVGASGKISIAIQNSKNWRNGQPCIAVTVGDSGPGIPTSIQSKIWEPFFSTKAETGTGLGLWLVEETVRKNGGSIRMRTATGNLRHGTVFRLLLPLEGIRNEGDEVATIPS